MGAQVCVAPDWIEDPLAAEVGEPLVAILLMLAARAWRPSRPLVLDAHDVVRYLDPLDAARAERYGLVHAVPGAHGRTDYGVGTWLVDHLLICGALVAVGEKER